MKYSEKILFVLRRIPLYIEHCGGFFSFMQKGLSVLISEGGVNGIKKKIINYESFRFQQQSMLINKNTPVNRKTIEQSSTDKPNRFKIVNPCISANYFSVPFCLDPSIDNIGAVNTKAKYAIYFYAENKERIFELVGMYANQGFDFYIAKKRDLSLDSISKDIDERMFFYDVEDSSHQYNCLFNNIAPKLTPYDLICFMSSSDTPENHQLIFGANGDVLLRRLNFYQNFLFANHCNVVTSNQGTSIDLNEIDIDKINSFVQKKMLLGTFTSNDPVISRYGAILPGHVLKDFINMLSADVQLREQCTKNESLVRALLYCFASRNGYGCLFVKSDDGGNDSAKRSEFYEDQIDFSNKLKQSNIRVLAYYLPQFHPIPENDAWHGKGFTEWTKVKSATPLFEGHYQPHVPHSDLGYYHLDNDEILKFQAELMKKAGLSGMIFYHYWFSGKLILETPAQRLLKNKSIDMPFCFCWANENWTRRWDGGDKEVLLEQVYSVQDAKEFIHYLIPFFKDRRYLRIDNRPILFVYRPTLLPKDFDYVAIWAEECKKNNLPAPYVVAVLTQGCNSPVDHGMDAGVERTLHDWTGGAVPERIPELQRYFDMYGSVLNYTQVAEFYEKQNNEMNFPYFRSIVPSWDNTARYGKRAYMLTKCKPKVFQHWLENIINYTISHQVGEEQIIVVNAWNEWGEGAHLEPDCYLGYAYLNCIGRALSHEPYPIFTLNKDRNAFMVSVLPNVMKQKHIDSNLWKRFVFHFKKICISSGACFFTDSEEVAKNFDWITLTLSKNDQINQNRKLIVNKLFFISSENFNELLNVSKSYRDHWVVPNTYFEIPLSAQRSNLLSFSDFYEKSALLVEPCFGTNNVKFLPEIHCFASVGFETSKSITVGTITRIHKGFSINELTDALLSLQAQQNCTVYPYIAAQNITYEQRQNVEKLLNQFYWSEGYEIKQFYCKKGEDIRSVLMNQSIIDIKTRYVAFLDYDDLLKYDAYSYLSKILCYTGKAVALGRVFRTYYKQSDREWISRQSIVDFETKTTYREFVQNNFIPLHSFLIDKERIDFSNVKYFDDQKYCEDYYFELQIFKSNNVAWEYLLENKYIGDYIFSIDRKHTLAMDDTEGITKDPHYGKCLKRVSELQQSLLDKFDSSVC